MFSGGIPQPVSVIATRQNPARSENPLRTVRVPPSRIASTAFIRMLTKTCCIFEESTWTQSGTGLSSIRTWTRLELRVTLEEGEDSGDDPVQIDPLDSRRRLAGEIEKPLDDLAGAGGLRDDPLHVLAPWIVRRRALDQQVSVEKDSAEWDC